MFFCGVKIKILPISTFETLIKKKQEKRSKKYFLKIVEPRSYLDILYINRIHCFREIYRYGPPKHSPR